METKKLGIGMLIILAVAGGTLWYISDELAKDYDFYSCNDTDPEYGTLCWKLSGGLGTRCYNNYSAPTRYKVCRNGWSPYTGDIIGNESKNVDMGGFSDLKEYFKHKNITRYNMSGKTLDDIHERYFEMIHEDGTSEIVIMIEVSPDERL